MLLHSCQCSLQASGSTRIPPFLRVTDIARGERTARRLPQGLSVIDLHNHVMSPEVEDLVKDHPEKLRLHALAMQASPSTHSSDQRQLVEARPRLLQADERIADMEAMGVDIQVLSPSPTQYYYWADEALSERLVALQNARIIDLCRAHPKRFLGFAAVSLRYPELAIRQLREAMAYPFMKGVEVSSVIGDIELADPKLLPFWEACEALNAVVFIHPLGTTFGPRFGSHYLGNIVGHPAETTVALLKMILSGNLDRLPKLRICGAHGGGYLPMYFGRSDHAWHAREDVHLCARPPSEYLRELYYDSLVFSPEQLRRLVDSVGVTQVVLGTDYPFDMGSYDPFGLTAEPLFSQADQEALLSRNARRLLRLAEEPPAGRLN